MAMAARQQQQHQQQQRHQQQQQQQQCNVAHVARMDIVFVSQLDSRTYVTMGSTD